LSQQEKKPKNLNWHFFYEGEHLTLYVNNVLAVEHDGAKEYYVFFPIEGGETPKRRVIVKKLPYANLAEDINWDTIFHGVMAALDLGVITPEQIQELPADEILYTIAGVTV
jgi:hypothetical protein